MWSAPNRPFDVSGVREVFAAVTVEDLPNSYMLHGFFCFSFFFEFAVTCKFCFVSFGFFECNDLSKLAVEYTFHS